MLVGNLVTTLEVVPLVSPVTPNLKHEEMPTPLEGTEMVASLVRVRIHATTLEVAPLVSLMTLDLKGEEMPEEVTTTLEGTEMDSPVPK